MAAVLVRTGVPAGTPTEVQALSWVCKAGAWCPTQVILRHADVGRGGEVQGVWSPDKDSLSAPAAELRWSPNAAPPGPLPVCAPAPAPAPPTVSPSCIAAGMVGEAGSGTSSSTAIPACTCSCPSLPYIPPTAGDDTWLGPDPCPALPRTTHGSSSVTSEARSLPAANWPPPGASLSC